MSSVHEFVVEKIFPDSMQIRGLRSEKAFMVRGEFHQQFIAGEILDISVKNIEEKLLFDWLEGEILQSRLDQKLPEQSHLEIQALAEGHYYFIHPQSWQAVAHKFNKAYSLLEKGKLANAEELFCNVLLAVPDYVDAYNHLGVIAFRRRAWPAMLKYYKIAFRICRSKIPNDFTDELRWILPSNQIFYRAVHGYVLALIRLEQFTNAVVLCEWMLLLDSSDYLGIGRMLVDVYLKLGEYKKLVQYFEVHGVANLDYYSLAIAHFQLGEFEKSARCLLKGVRYNPYLCQLFVGQFCGHDFGEPKILPQGSFPEAMAYFQENQGFWEREEVLQNFIVKLSQIPVIAAFFSKMNQNDSNRIKSPELKRSNSSAGAEPLTDEAIEQLLASPALQQIISSIPVTNFKLM